MSKPSLTTWIKLALFGAALVAAPVHAKDAWEAANIIVPQSRSFRVAPMPPSDSGRVGITAVSADVTIRDGAASTTLTIDLHNRSRQREEAVLLLPVPAGAVVSAFDFQGAGAEPSAEVLPAHEARRIYDRIVSQIKDPALLEFAGLSAVRTSVFPVEAGGSQRVRLTYEHILEADGERFDYVLPRSESLELRRPWTVNATVVSQRPISTVYSPSHKVIAQRLSAGEFDVALEGGSSSDAGAFRLSYLVASEQGLSGTLFAYPDPSVGGGAGGGYFLFMGGLPAGVSERADHPRREVTIVIDRSGSMAGAKIDQARDAAMQIVEGLEPGELFNIIAYSSTVMKFAPMPVPKDEGSRAEALRFIASIQPRGGTNIHDAVYEALAQRATPDAIPLVLFLTDGLPTIGKTAEVDIRDMVERANPHERRIFTFGVGHDVNAPLLERLADVTRGKAAFVLPGEDVELAVARVFRQLQGPVFAGLTFNVLGADGKPTTRRVDDLIPQIVPDLFDGDQLIVLGKYVGAEPIAFRLDGRFLGRASTFRFDFDLAHATTRNAFVPRLWASRRIAFLIDEVRQAGAASGERPPLPGETILASPAYQELIDEIVRLSREWGILTEYTSFLAREGTDLTDEQALKLGCQVQLEDNAVRRRAGAEAVRQSLNSVSRKWQATANISNEFIDLEGHDVEFTQVQQMNDRALYKRGGTWIDSRIVAGDNDSLVPDSVCAIGTDTYRALTARLAGENRAGVLSLSGDLLLLVDGKVVLVTPGAPAQP